MEKKVFDIVLLLALPASGKSEVRNFMASIDPDRLIEEFHIGDNLQLDDFPYVNFMRLIDEELEKNGLPSVFYDGNGPFLDGRDWGTLISLLNEDYKDMLESHIAKTDSYASYLFKRIDNAGKKVGISERLLPLGKEILQKIAVSLEEEAKKIEMEKENQYTDDLQNKTFIIECARGGKDKSAMPLTSTYGYQYSLPVFSDEILKNASILYIWVTPEESRRKNEARANPDDPGSNLFHGVPLSVMLNDYGCDDMLYLKKISDIKDTVKIQKNEKVFHLPIGIFDNRIDKTSFLREDQADWKEEQIEEMTVSVRMATDTMWKNRNSSH